MEYKRVTSSYSRELLINSCNAQTIKEIISRLCELEDKIESGELILSKDCSKCKYENNLATQYPCSHCCYCYTGKFEPKGAGNG